MDQGARVDSCFHCVFVRPELRGPACPECHGAPRFVRAQMMSPEMAKEKFEELVRRGTEARRLLEFAHLYGVVLERELLDELVRSL
jgi:hypothetical protein